MKPFSQCLVALLLLLGCGKSYVPKPPTPEELEIKQSLSAHAQDLKAALAKSGDYVQVAVLDRSTEFSGDDQVYSRVLVLHREVLDLDDYGLSLPGKEDTGSEQDRVPGFFNEVMFWIDNNGEILFDDSEQPPGTEMVVEWCVANTPGDKVSLHFGGNLCLEIDLAQD